MYRKRYSSNGEAVKGFVLIKKHDLKPEKTQTGNML